MRLAEYVYNYRKEHGLSMQAFGDMCGLSRAYISILEKGINPTTGKPFVPAIETLKKIADATNSDIDTLLKIIDGTEHVKLNVTPTLSPTAEPLTHHELQHIKKYRQLDADGRERVDAMLDIEFAQIQRKNDDAQKEEVSCVG
ncbi:helix-turn-helix domain-containing protein [Phascolarctobacterium sp.]|uniref:helix-turn-helix domain-containing protein n=1 Tax=Phascolarctobacterium sp. TaxID=2049039 RepID=UPI00386AA47E